MIEFWILACLLFIVVTFILAKLTLKKRREERGEKMWKLWDGMTKYWLRLSMASLVITAGIMFVLRWIGLPFLP